MIQYWSADWLLEYTDSVMKVYDTEVRVISYTSKSYVFVQVVFIT